MDGKPKMGCLYLFTFGLFGLGWFVDCVVALLEWAALWDWANIKNEIRGFWSEVQTFSCADPALGGPVALDCNSMDGREFEQLVADVLRANGFSSVRLTKASADRGVDVTAIKDGKRYAIQCKRYASKVGNAAVQQVYAGKAIYGCDVAVVVTNSSFTDQAKQDACALGVELWDGRMLQFLVGSNR